MFPFHLVQSANTEFLLMKIHRVLNRLSKCANVSCRKNQGFYNFTINSQSKLEKFSTLFLRYLPRKMFDSGLLESEILEIFTAVVFVKNFHLTLNFFKYCRLFSLKTRKRSQEIRKLSKNCLSKQETEQQQ